MTFEYHPTVTVTECNLCGHGRFESLVYVFEKGVLTIRNTDRYGLPVTLVRCMECGLRFINPRMSDEQYADFYRQGHYRRLMEEMSCESFGPDAIDKQQAPYADRLVRRLAPFMRREGALLDIGGATGLVAETVATAFDLDPTVLEPCEAELERAATRANMEVIHGVLGLGTNVLKSGMFDVILLCQTVEHLTDIKAALAEVRRLLAPGGVFFVDIAKGSRPKVDHCYYLDMGTMLLYLERAGFGSVDAREEIGGVRFPKVKRISFVAVGP